MKSATTVARRQPASTQHRRTRARALFTVTIFVSASLLFFVEPMVAKMILPKFGGSSGVWNSCIVFFQFVLLAGYAYAHLISTRLSIRSQVVVQLGLTAVGLLVLPVAVSEEWTPAGDANPIAPLLGLLAVCVGLPFFVLCSNAPLLQNWFVRTGDPAGKDPYFLYAASNAGSLIALLAYPLFFEAQFPLVAQSWLWTAGYSLLLVLVSCSALLVWSAARPGAAPAERRAGMPSANARPASGSVRARMRLRWLLLAAVPSSLMLSVTTFLSSDVAAIPLLWVIPLALYLLTFILAFSSTPRWFRRAAIWSVPVGILWLTYVIVSDEPLQTGTLVAHLVTFFLIALVCHGQLADSRPPAEALTEFYLWVAAGGALGSLFTGLAAPLLFNWVAEYPLALMAAAILIPAFVPNATGRLTRRLNTAFPVVLGLAVAAVFLWHTYLSRSSGNVIQRERTFYSVFTVQHRSDGKSQWHSLVHGTVAHGQQYVSDDPAKRRLPQLYYYFPSSPIAQVFNVLYGSRARQRVGVIGLGAGSLAAFGVPGEEYTFFELDPAVERVARDTRYFTFLSDAKSRGGGIRVLLGDARLTLRNERDHRYGLLVLDAFSSDSIPVHLLTREALELYLSKLEDGGVLAFNVSNAYLDLEPVLANLADRTGAGLAALIQHDNDISGQDLARGKAPSGWVVMARRPEDLEPIVKLRRWKRLKHDANVPLWTDDYSNILKVFHLP